MISFLKRNGLCVSRFGKGMYLSGKEKDMVFLQKSRKGTVLFCKRKVGGLAEFQKGSRVLTYEGGLPNPTMNNHISFLL